MSLKFQETSLSVQLQELVLGCNKLAMDYLRQENFSSSFHLLRRAQDILSLPQSSTSKTKLLSITYNNLGCYYKKVGKLNIALQFLQKALDLSINSPVESTNLAGTHLNICAIKSQLGNHDSAVKSVTKAISLLSEAERYEKTENIVNTLAIAYYNAGIEYELLGFFAKAEEAYRLGIEKAKSNKTETHHVMDLLIKNYNALKAKYVVNNQKYNFEKINIKPNHQRANSTQSNRKYNLNGSLPAVRISSARPKERRQNTSFELSGDVNLENSLPNNRDIIKQTLKKNFKQKNSKKDILQDIAIIPPNPVVKNERARPVSGKARVKIRQNVSDKPFLNIEEKLKHIENQILELELKDESFREFLTGKEDFKINTPIKPPLANPAKSHLRSGRILIDKNKHAVTIQKYWRGYKARKYYLKLKTQIAEQKAKALLQKPQEKIFQEKKVNIPPLSQQRNPVRFIKSAKRFRPSVLASIPESKCETHDGKILLIQSHVRRFLAQRKYQKIIKSAIKIQSLIRQYQTRSLYEIIRSAAIFIQSVWRGYCVRKLLM
ncbi:unnamed protein product [Blepharisma stoltei]|uniref:Uncharacterized protein n=1 Tax=Blepharisma stoltei TaxID=1481888 RepID=A0AAU9KA34_9CILI|nr:unnamed protein product [Blepharisma stoltei]